MNYSLCTTTNILEGYPHVSRLSIPSHLSRLFCSVSLPSDPNLPFPNHPPNTSGQHTFLLMREKDQSGSSVRVVKRVQSLFARGQVVHAPLVVVTIVHTDYPPQSAHRHPCHTCVDERRVPTDTRGSTGREMHLAKRATVRPIHGFTGIIVSAQCLVPPESPHTQGRTPR